MYLHIKIAVDSVLSYHISQSCFHILYHLLLQSFWWPYSLSQTPFCCLPISFCNRHTPTFEVIHGLVPCYLLLLLFSLYPHRWHPVEPPSIDRRVTYFLQLPIIVLCCPYAWNCLPEEGQCLCSALLLIPLHGTWLIFLIFVPYCKQVLSTVNPWFNWLMGGGSQFNAELLLNQNIFRSVETNMHRMYLTGWVFSIREGICPH